MLLVNFRKNSINIDEYFEILFLYQYEKDFFKFYNVSIYREKVRKYIEKSYGINKKNFNYLKKIEKYYSACG